MAAPNAHDWRFIVRSKDRISGTPNNFVAQLPNQIPENCDEVYIRLASIACGTYPSPTDVLTLTTSSYSNGGYAIQPNIPAASATANPYSFSTASAVDVCMNFSTLSTLDTETAGNALKSYVTSVAIPANASAVTTLTIPFANRSGINDFTGWPWPPHNLKSFLFQEVVWSLWEQGCRLGPPAPRRPAAKLFL